MGPQPPELYHHYVGHDDNRDWYIFTQPETRNTAALENKWHPEIVYDVHQMGPNTARIFVPPWMDPIDPNIDPILASLCNSHRRRHGDGSGRGRQNRNRHERDVRFLVARAAVSGLSRRSAHSDRIGQREAGDADHDQRRATSPINALGYNPRERSWNYLNPWMEGTWHLRDIIDYQSIAFESLLYQAAVRRSDMLRYFYEINKHNVERATPNAFVIPASQNDPGAAKKMLETLTIRRQPKSNARQRHSPPTESSIAAGSYVIQHAAAVFGMGEDAAGASGLSGSAALSRRSAETSLRCDGANPAHADGRRRGHREGLVPCRAQAGGAVLLHAGSRRRHGCDGRVRRLFLERGREDLESGQAGLSRYVDGRFLCIRRQRAQGDQSAAHRALSELSIRAWTKAGRAGCSTISVSPTPPCTTPMYRPATCASKFDVIVMPDQPAQQIANGHPRGRDAAGILRRARRQRARRL